MDLRKNETKDWWNEIFELEKESIELGLSDAGKGRLNPNSEVKKYMESGYKILWTDHALEELAKTFEYLETHFTNKEIKKLSVEIDK